MDWTKYDDDDIVDWMRLRAEGHTSTAIAEAFNARSSYVRAATNRVVKDDALHHADRIRFTQGDHQHG